MESITNAFNLLAILLVVLLLLAGILGFLFLRWKAAGRERGI